MKINKMEILKSKLQNSLIKQIDLEEKFNAEAKHIFDLADKFKGLSLKSESYQQNDYID
jgi:hypothetical protein